jgi:hypothetical protein
LLVAVVVDALELFVVILDQLVQRTGARITGLLFRVSATRRAPRCAR